MLFRMDSLKELIMRLPIIIFALTVHEVSHGYAALKMGDPTAKNLGRLTLNPLKHLDLFGFLAMLIAPIGWAKPVPIIPRNFKNYKKGIMLVSLAGPLSNLLLAILMALLYYQGFSRINMPVALAYNLWLFCETFIILNIGLGVFNLLPIPPLDGSKIFLGYLPHKVQEFLTRNQTNSLIVLLVIIYFLSGTLNFLTYSVYSGLKWLIMLIPF